MMFPSNILNCKLPLVAEIVEQRMCGKVQCISCLVARKRASYFYCENEAIRVTAEQALQNQFIFHTSSVSTQCNPTKMSTP